MLRQAFILVLCWRFIYWFKQELEKLEKLEKIQKSSEKPDKQKKKPKIKKRRRFKGFLDIFKMRGGSFSLNNLTNITDELILISDTLVSEKLDLSTAEL